MAEYIDREQMEDVLHKEYYRLDLDSSQQYGFAEAMLVIRTIPSAADVAPVRRGKWDIYKDECICSVCHETMSYDKLDPLQPYSYCPNCGAKMDGERKET